MNITKNIFFKNFNKKFSLFSHKKLKLLLKDNNEIINSLKPNYKYSYSNKIIHKYKNFSILRIIGQEVRYFF